MRHNENNDAQKHSKFLISQEQLYTAPYYIPYILSLSLVSRQYSATAAAAAVKRVLDIPNTQGLACEI